MNPPCPRASSSGDNTTAGFCPLKRPELAQRFFQKLAPRTPRVDSVATLTHGNVRGPFFRPLQHLHFRCSVVCFSLAFEALPAAVRLGKSTGLIVVFQDVDLAERNMSTVRHRVPH